MRSCCYEEESEESEEGGSEEEEEVEEVESEENASLFLCEGSAASRICKGTRDSISTFVAEVLFGIRCTCDLELDICCTLAGSGDPNRSPAMACRGHEKINCYEDGESYTEAFRGDPSGHW